MPDEKHALRQIRYIALNPCRAGLTQDPLEWPWSTYRGCFGGVAQPWVSLDVLAELLGWDSVGAFRTWFHKYVSSDPTVNPTGTPVLKLNHLSENQTYPHLENLIAATLVAAEATPAVLLGSCKESVEIGSVIVHLAEEYEWKQSGLLATRLLCTSRTVQRYRRRKPNALLFRAAKLCLNDNRLTSTFLKMSSNATFFQK